MTDKPLPSIHTRDVHGHCPACGNPTLRLGDDGRIVCTLMDCPRPDLVNELIGDIADARSHAGYTFCSQLVGHVTMTAFAKKITEKVTAVGQRAEAVKYADEQKQRADQLEELLAIAHETSNTAETERARLAAELVALRKEQDEYAENVVGDLNEANIGLARQAARAEAAIERVRQLVAENQAEGTSGEPCDADTLWPSEILAALDEPADTTLDIPVDKNGLTIPNVQVRAGESVDDGADTPAAEFSDGEVFEYGCFNCCKPIVVGQLAEHRCEQPEQSARTTADNSPTSSDAPDNPPQERP